MRFNNFFSAFILVAVAFGCGQSGSELNNVGTSNTRYGTSVPVVTGPNVMALTVNGTTCAANSYANKPCVSVTVCPAGGGSGNANCKTITDILLDTGSYGLRVFGSVLGSTLYNTSTHTSANLNQVTDGSGNEVAQCMKFGDGSADWGGVFVADVVLGGEAAVTTPIQVIDKNFGTVPGSCSGPDAAPTDAGFNGILGVGLFAQDCGLGCQQHVGNGIYYGCTSPTGSCSMTAVDVASQVQNPVTLLPVDNNGIQLQLPSVPLGGVSFASGNLILGIGTQSNNQPSNVQTFTANGAGRFTTTYGGTDYSSFIDSGSNALYFPGSLPDCGGSFSGFFCPNVGVGQAVELTAITKGVTNSTQSQVSFQIGNLATFDGSNNVFVDIGATGTIGGQTLFDWGLPFFLGRPVFVGFEGQSSSLGSGTYWAY